MGVRDGRQDWTHTALPWSVLKVRERGSPLTDLSLKVRGGWGGDPLQGKTPKGKDWTNFSKFEKRNCLKKKSVQNCYKKGGIAKKPLRTNRKRNCSHTYCRTNIKCAHILHCTTHIIDQFWYGRIVSMWCIYLWFCGFFPKNFRIDDPFKNKKSITDVGESAKNRVDVLYRCFISQLQCL